MKIIKAHFFSIKTKINLQFILFILTPFLVLGIITYNQSIKIIEGKTYQNMYQTLELVEKEYNTIKKEVDNISYILIPDINVRSILRESETSYKIYHYHKQLNFLLNNHISNKPYIYSVDIFNDDTVVYSSLEEIVRTEMPILCKDEVIQSEGRTYWDRMQFINGTKVLASYRLLRDIDTHKDLGFIRINVTEKALYDVCKDVTFGEGTNIQLLSDKGVILSGNNHNIDTMIEDSEFQQLITSNKVFNASVTNKQVKVIYKSSTFNFYIYVTIPAKSIYKEINTFKILLFTAFIGFLLFSLVFQRIYSKNITIPINALVTQLKKVNGGNFDICLEHRRNDEIGFLIKSINKMLIKIKDLIKNMYELKVKEKDAQLKALQAQINPHFLYNSLDTVRWLIRRNKNESACEYVQALSNMFRHNLENNNNPLITLGMELKQLENYVYIQKIKYQDRLKFQIKVNSIFYPCQLIRFILQPLIENALVHGIEELDGVGIIIVEAIKQGEELILRVKDNGLGTDADIINELIHTKKNLNKAFALRNIDSRLKSTFGEQYGLSFESEIGVGTCISLKIPYCINKE